MVVILVVKSTKLCNSVTVTGRRNMKLAVRVSWRVNFITQRNKITPVIMALEMLNLEHLTGGGQAL